MTLVGVSKVSDMMSHSLQVRKQSEEMKFKFKLKLLPTIEASYRIYCVVNAQRMYKYVNATMLLFTCTCCKLQAIK